MAASVKCQIKPITKSKTNYKTRKKKTIEGILFNVFNKMVTRINQEVFQTYLYFVGNFLTSFIRYLLLLEVFQSSLL